MIAGGKAESGPNSGSFGYADVDVEDACELIGRKPAARVLDLDRDPSILVPRRHPDGAVVLDRIERIR